MKSGIIILIFLQAVVICQSQQIENRGINLSGFSTDYHSLPFIDLDRREDWQTVVDREDGQYLGHPTTVLLDDGKTIYCVYPKGHGRGPIVMKRSLDGGLTWGERLPVPDNWSSSLEVPTLYPVRDASGQDRVIMFSGLYPARMAYSEDGCQTWTPLQPIGTWGGIVVMGDLIPLQTGKGHYMALFHDDERFFSAAGRSAASEEAVAANQPPFTLYKTLSFDGGVTWTYPQNVYSSSIIHLCEPGLIRSPDGKQIAMLLRENSRRLNSFIMFSDDEGKTWSPPRELPNSLTGDRHQIIYTDDGRLLISFRDLSPAIARFKQLKDACLTCDEKILAAKAGPVSPTAGDWVGWVGSYEDLLNGQEGQYRLRFKDNTRGSDCAYPALELLPDGHIVATTYGYWEDGEEPYILSFRFKMQDLDKMAPR
jgi:hypothetical protein